MSKKNMAELLGKLLEAADEPDARETASLLEFRSEEEAFNHMRKVYALKPGDRVILHSQESGRLNAIFRRRDTDDDRLCLVLWDKEHGLYGSECSPLAIEVPEGLMK